MTTKNRNETNYIVVHCSATPNGREHDAADIDRWHRERGWLMIGYHYVIKLDGTVETGRDVDVIGAHVKGHNAESVGICMIGTDEYTSEQYQSLYKLIKELQNRYPKALIFGHRDFDGVTKSCPGFDVVEWMITEDSIN